MCKSQQTTNDVASLVQEINREIGVLRSPSGPRQWIRRSVFEKRINELERKAKTVNERNAIVCRWLHLDLRALGTSVKKLKNDATEENRRMANERYAERRLQNAKADPVLKRLHPAQQRAVVVAEDTQLVLAGAGTGKTETMAAKVADVLRRGRTEPKRIAVVTFTKKAAKEISDRIERLAGQSVDEMFVGTIHGLGRRLLTQATGRGPRIDPIAEPRSSQRYRCLKRMLDDVLMTNNGLREALAVRAQAHVRLPPNDGEHGETVRVSLRTGSIDVRSHGEAAICRVLDNRGIRFEYEASYVEERASEEERAQPPEVAKMKDECRKTGYRPDFKIDLGEDFIVWLEHWGIDEKGNPPKEWDDPKKYIEDMLRKRQAHKTLGTRLAETRWGQYKEVLNGDGDWDCTVMKAVASAAGWDLGSLNQRFPCRDDGWTPGAQTIQTVVQEVSEWIDAAGRCGLEEVAIRRRIEEIDGMNALDEARALAALALAVRTRYDAHLEDRGTTDFQKMVLDATRVLEFREIRPEFDMVIVDEWQDVNGAQERFVRALSKHGGSRGRRPSLCVVGDDWQSIYGFQGGDPGYTRDFSKKGDACERTDLTRTWRFGKARADATRHWALGDRDAVDKEIEGDEGKDDFGVATEIVGRTITAEGARRLGGSAGEESAETAVRAILRKIGEKRHSCGQDAKVLLLARRRNTVADRDRPASEEERSVLEEWRQKPWQIPHWVNERDEEEVRDAARKRALQNVAEGLDHRALRAEADRADVALDLETLTVHGAKGSQADHVVFVQGPDRRVKEESRENALERALRPLRPAGANGPEEERRVWYVALTRARATTYVVEPPADAADTALFDELWRDENREYGVGEAELADWLEPCQGDTPCPKCAAAGQRGRLVGREAKQDGGVFVACTSFRLSDADIAGAKPCGHTERRCPHCQKGIVRRLNRRRGQCTNHACKKEVPLCECRIPKPMTIRRNRATGERFWGCQDYRGPDNPACGKTRRLACASLPSQGPTRSPRGTRRRGRPPAPAFHRHRRRP